MTNSSNVTLSLTEQSLKDQDTQAYVNVAILIVGFATLLSNIAVIFGIYKGPFRSLHYKLLAHMTAVACIQAFNMFIYLGVIRLMYTILRMPGNLTVRDCGLVFIVLELTLIVDPYNVLIVSADRLIAVAYPFRYKNMNLSKKYKIFSFSAPWVVGFIELAVKFLLWTNEFVQKNVSVCLISNTRTPDYLSYRYYKGVLISVLTIYFYLLGIFLVKYKVSKDSNNSQQLKKELGFKLIVTCGTDAIIYTFTYFFSQVYQSAFIVPATPQARLVIAPAAAIFILLATTPRFLVLYCLNTEFKKVIKRNIFRRNQISIETTTKVTTLTTTLM